MSPSLRFASLVLALLAACTTEPARDVVRAETEGARPKPEPPAVAAEPAPEAARASEPSPEVQPPVDAEPDAAAARDAATSAALAEPASARAGEVPAPAAEPAPRVESAPVPAAPVAAQAASAPPRAEASGDAPRAPKRLRLEYLENPIGIEEPRPRFSWELDDPRRGAVQSAYEIAVAPSRDALLAGAAAWTTGRVASDATNQIEYAGPPLRYDAESWWRVRTWDARGVASPWSEPASWRMGPMTHTDWKGVWIADAAPVDKPKPAHDGWHSGWKPNEDDLVWVQIDFGQARPFEELRLHPARPRDGEPGYLFPLKYRVWVSDEPTFMKKAVPTHIVDETFVDVPNPGGEPKAYRIGSRMNVRYVRFGFLKLAKDAVHGHGVALSEIELVDFGQVVSKGVAVSCSDSLEEGGWGLNKLFDGDKESHPAHDVPTPPAPLLRHEFVLDAPVKRATAYATALGLYELSFNGRRAGDRVLAPEWTRYDGRVQYQAYDVTALLAQGRNAIGALLGEGWYAGRIGLADQFPGFPARGLYGDKPLFLMQLEVDLADGEHVTVTTRPETWKTTLEGPLRSNDLLDGETFDARRALVGWDRAGFDDAQWKPAENIGEPDQGIYAQPCEPIRVVEELPAISVREAQEGVWLFDVGRNVTGVCRLTCTGAAGSAVVLRHGEMLDADGRLYTANLRKAAQTDRFVLRGGGRETFEPRFTYHGFRYVEVRGLAGKPEPGDLVARVLRTAARETSTFECSDPVLNGLWTNSRASLRGNLTGIATDCPQRDERLGWLGDFGAFAQTAMYQMDLAAFLGKWTADVREAQARNGGFPDFAPHPFNADQRFSCSPGWADAGVSVPWLAWVNYGDKRLLERHFAAMQRHVDFVMNYNRQFRWDTMRGNDYGDWLNGSTIVAEGWDTKGCEVSKDVFAWAFLRETTRTLGRIARVLRGNEDPSPVYQGVLMGYSDYSDNVRHAFQTKWINPEGRIDGETQAGYALALAFDLVPGELRARTAERLQAAIEARGGQLTTGFHTTHRALIELSRAGLPADAYASEARFPALGWQLAQGATTMWERRDGFVPGRGFQDPGMNSFDHFAFGSVGEWMMGWLLGLRPDEQAPGWKHFLVAPAPTAKVTSARGSHDTIRGRIEVAWTKTDGAFELEVLVPAGTSATVRLPARSGATITEGGKPLADAAPHATLARSAEGFVEIEAKAGRYRFRAE
jgi:alpha-L-rhamnosidase